MKRKEYFHLNDKTMKYMSSAQIRRQHKYLGLPGEYIRRYPQEVIFPNMVSGRADEIYETKEGMIVNLEEESVEITDDSRKKFGKYIIFCAYMYSDNIYNCVICHKKPSKNVEYYKMGPSVYIKIHYIYILNKIIFGKNMIMLLTGFNIKKD